MKKQITFLRTVLLVAVMLWGVVGGAKAIVSTFAVGPGTYSGYDATYTTIALAYAAIPSTITGPYVIELQSDYVPAASEYPITFTTAKTGASDINSITIRPATGAKLTIGPANKTVIATVTASTVTSTMVTSNATATVDVNLTGIITSGAFSDITVGSYISGIGTYTSNTFKTVSAVNAGTSTITAAIGAFTAASVANNKLFIGPAQTCAFKFNGCKYVTIDGVSRTGATGLTIQNPNCIYAQAIMFTNASQYNTVKNCIIRGANQSGAWNNGYDGTVYFSGATYTTIANNDICDMGDSNIPYPISSIQMTSAGGTNTNQTITNNNIYNISNLYSGNGNYGFLVFGSDANANNFNITYNRFYWTAETTFKSASYNFFAFATIGSGHRFEGNVIGYGAADGTGTSTLAMTGTPGTSYGFSGLKNSVFKNNTIGGITINNGGAFVPINLAPNTAGTVSADSICYGNSIKDITINATTNNSTLYGIFFNAAPNCNVNVKNNVIKNLTISSSTASNAENIAAISHNFGYSYALTITTTVGTAATITSAPPAAGTYTLSGNANIPVGTTFTYSGSNSITLSAAATAAATGTATTATPTSIVAYINCTGNEVSNLTAGSAGSSANHSITGFISGGFTNIYDKNLVYNLNTITSNTGAVIKGMRFAISKSSGITVKNNIIRLGTDVTSDATISAIINEGLSSNGHAFNIYHNSIYIGGGTGLTLTKPSHCFNHSTGANYGNILIKNNIFSNLRVGGAVNQVYNLMALNEINASSNNLYQYGTQFATVTTTSPATYVALSDWNTARITAILTTDANSVNQTSPQYIAPIASTPDLRVKTNYTVVAAKGADLSAVVTDDYYGTSRAAITTPALGAYQFTCTSAVTDYFRSLSTGNWSSAATWQASPDNTNWASATAIPTTSAASVNILNGHTVSVDASANVSTLTLNSGSVLNVNAGKQLTVSTTLTNNSGTLNLLSHNINGTATILTPASLSGTGGTYVVNQNLSTGRNWYISNPTSATTLPTVASGTLTLNGYNEAAVIDALGATGWQPNPASVEVGNGYVASVSADGDLSFTGALNTGNKNITLTSRTGTSNKAGFNLIGNPYPSYLDWDAVMAANTDKLRSSTLWYRTKLENAQHEMVYSFWTVNGDGVSVPNGASVKIPPMQSFWVRALAGGSTLNLNNAMRSHAPETDKLLKAPAAKNTDRTLIRLQVSNGINSDETVIYFSEKAKDGFDSNDAPKMSNGNAAIPEIFTTLDNEKIVINSMNTMPLNQEIKLGFVAGNATSFRLKANEITNLTEGVKIILKDNATKAETDLTDGVTAYQFAPEVTSTDRFSLIFRTIGSSTDVQKPNSSVAQVYVNAANQITIIASEKSNYAIYNAIGQLIENGTLNSGLQTTNCKLQNGIFVVKIGNQSNRVIIK